MRLVGHPNENRQSYCDLRNNMWYRKQDVKRKNNYYYNEGQRGAPGPVGLVTRGVRTGEGRTVPGAFISSKYTIIRR